MVETETNVLLSDFMELNLLDGLHKYPTKDGTCTYMFLKYHEDRNWLHLVWEKFRDLKIEDLKAEIEHSVFIENISYNICFQNIEKAYQSIVSGIQWYNLINK